MSACVALVASAGLLLLPGCGGERAFESQEIVSELNRAGAGIELGSELLSVQPQATVHEIAFAGEAEHDGEAAAEKREREADPEEHGQAHSGGSLYIFADQEAALQKYGSCERGGLLICYRVANAVLIFEDPAVELQRLERAVRVLGDSA